MVKRNPINLIRAMTFGMAMVMMPLYAEEGRNTPPPMEACKGKNNGDTCSFTDRMNNQVNGTCRTPPRANGQTICMPKPPAQAFDACSTKIAGDACTFTNQGNNTINGICRKGPAGEGKLFCAHKRPPGQGLGQENNQPTQ